MGRDSEAGSIKEDQRDLVDPVLVLSVVAPFVQPRSRQQQSRGSGSGKGGKHAQGQKRRLDEISGGSEKVCDSCFGCGSMEHRVANCPSREADPEARVCFLCRESGHNRCMCPKSQQKTVAEITQ